MDPLYPMKGIVTVLNTPFTITNSLDEKALKRNVQRALNAGVNGFLIPAMASEISKLSKCECLKMVELVYQEVNGQVPVFAGAGKGEFEQNFELIKCYLQNGFRKVLVHIPFSDERTFRSQFLKIADLKPQIIMLQDWDPSGYGLPNSLILDLFNMVEPFKCLKIETVPAGIKYSKILELTAGKLNISGGWAVTQMFEGLERGVHAFMPTGMHYIYTKIYNCYISGRNKEAWHLYKKILPILSFSNQHLDISIHFFKRLLFKQGIFATSKVREPILEFDKVHEEITSKLIERVIDLEEQIQSNRT